MPSEGNGAVPFVVERVGPPIVEGAVYVYVNPRPEWAVGHRYRVHRIVVSVPSYQEQVLTEGLTGRDEGKWFVCSLANFAVRFKME